jgi:hypothetical protein
MAGACRGVAETATWEAYHARLADLVSTFLAARA